MAGYFVAMPIYEFIARRQARQRILVRSSDWKGTECPHCGSKKTVQEIFRVSPPPAPAATARHHVTAAVADVVAAIATGIELVGTAARGHPGGMSLP